MSIHLYIGPGGQIVLQFSNVRSWKRFEATCVEYCHNYDTVEQAAADIRELLNPERRAPTGHVGLWKTGEGHDPRVAFDPDDWEQSKYIVRIKTRDTTETLAREIARTDGAAAIKLANAVSRWGAVVSARELLAWVSAADASAQRTAFDASCALARDAGANRSTRRPPYVCMYPR